MRIWIVHQNAIPRVVMGPTRHYDLASQLIAKGHEVVIFAGNYCHNSFHFIAPPYRKTKKIAYYGQVPFIWIDVPAYQKNSVARLWNMLLFAKKVADVPLLATLATPDVIIGSSPSPFAAFSAQKLANYYKVPFIYEIRDLWPATLVSLGHFTRRHPLVRVMQHIENKLLQKAQKIISPLPGVQNYLADQDFASEKILWLPNGVNMSQIPYSPPVMKDELTVFYAGAFNVSNNVETLLQAAKYLQTSGHNKIKIKIMGQGPLRDHLQNIASVAGLNNVQFTPMVSKDNIYACLADADVCVGMVKKSQLYAYGTSLNKIADYLAVGRPVIFALDSPYNPVLAANAGLTVPPEDPESLAQAIVAISQLSSQQRQQLGSNGRAYAEQHYDMQQLAARLIAHL
jgi:glycosyltransferase involved in cell wall biosynthesis